MKKLIRLIVGCLAAINVFMLTAFAAIPSPEVYTSVGEKSNLCEKSLMQEEETFLMLQM